MKKNKIKVLMVDDEKKFRKILCSELEDLGFQVDQAGNLEEAQQKVGTHNPDVTLLDLNLSGQSGLEGMAGLKSLAPLMEVIILTGFGTIETAVEAIKRGAYDYVEKPASVDKIVYVIQRAYEKKQLAQQKDNLSFLYHQKLFSYQLIGEDPAFQAVKGELEKVAPTEVSVLICGESGTGKELIAREIHRLSQRSHNPFVDINCSNFPSDLFESLLFGHAKGAFTGASKTQKGLVEAAQDGTLFLDEIGELSPSLQPKLLRFLETGQYRRVGEVVPQFANLRILAATNRDLTREIEEKQFREDLFYRLNTFTIQVPSLRQRKEDIPLLMDYFLNHQGLRKWKCPAPMIKAFREYSWPGNIRQLKNTLERIKILSSTEGISPDVWKNSLPKEGAGPMTSLGDGSLAELEKKHILACLTAHGGNKSKTAEALGISLRGLYNKLKQHDLEQKG